MDQLYQYDWPGNIRELKTVIHRLVILNSDHDVIESVPREFLVGIRDTRKADLGGKKESSTAVPGAGFYDDGEVNSGYLTFKENEVLD